MNAFKIFGLPEQFEVGDIDKKYYELFKTNEQASLNAAYKILKDPISRAKLLCELNGYTKANNEIAKQALQGKLEQNLSNIEEHIFAAAQAQYWSATWHWLQVLGYVKRMRKGSS